MINSVSILFATLMALIFAPLAAEAAPKTPPANPLTSLSGLWYTENHEGGIQLYPCDGKICGRFYWMKNKEGSADEDGVSRDFRNPDPALRRRPLCHMQFMSNFTPDDE